MKKTFGIIEGSYFFLSTINFRKYILIFDEIFLHDFDRWLPILKSTKPKFFIEDINWLIESGILTEISKPPILADLLKDENIWSDFETYIHMDSNVKNILSVLGDKSRPGSERENAVIELYKYFLNSSSYGARIYSTVLRDCYSIDVCPIIPVFDKSPDVSLNESTDILNIIIKKLPIPNRNTSFERIIDFRSDPDTKYKLHKLRNWTSDIAKQNLTANEIEDKIDWLLHDYKKHMELYKIKYDLGTIQTVVVSIADCAENLIKFNWGKLAKSLFELSHKKIELMEQEMKAPGNELAYIASIEEKFS